MSEDSTGAVVDYILKKEWTDFRAYADQVMEIERASFPVPWSEISFEEEINKGHIKPMGALSEQRICAYICFWMFDKEIHILNFAVHPQKGDKGLEETC
jgi:ribosomal-protein-alanine N-acetyltransferase